MQADVYVYFPGQCSELSIERKKKYNQNLMLELWDGPVANESKRPYLTLTWN
jgi:hypothetical protein